MNAFGGQDFFDGPIIMGVVNVTPDSFSDGGDSYNKNKAIERGLRLVQEGAHIVDVGGESTRPGAQAVDVEQEIARVVPVIEGLALEGVAVSLDTRNAATMQAGLTAGAWAINDISGLVHDSESIDIVSRAQCPVFIMHMQGVPNTMQEKPMYSNVVDDVYQYLQSRILACETQGIDKENIIIDVGIGFGKTLEHNLLLLRNISKFHDLGCAQLLGCSRKSFIAQVCDGEPADQRLAGSLSSVIWGASQGVQMFRVHDVKETVQGLAVYDAIASA